MKKIILSSILMFISLFETNLYAQTYQQLAQSSFSQGDYDRCLNYCKLSYGEDGVRLSDLESKSKSCKSYVQVYTDAMAAQNYTQAYNACVAILNYNPNDPTFRQRLSQTERLKKQQTDPSPSADTRVKRYNIGDEIKISYEKYKICWLDETRQHGWIMRTNRYVGYYTPEYGKEWRRPSKDEMLTIYTNRRKLGLSGVYPTSTRAKKIMNYIKYYILDFGTGKFGSKDAADLPNPVIEIKNF